MTAVFSTRIMKHLYYLPVGYSETNLHRWTNDLIDTPTGDQSNKESWEFLIWISFELWHFFVLNLNHSCEALLGYRQDSLLMRALRLPTQQRIGFLWASSVASCVILSSTKSYKSCRGKYSVLYAGSLTLHCVRFQVLCIKTTDEIPHQLIGVCYPIFITGFIPPGSFSARFLNDLNTINLHFPALGVVTSQSIPPLIGM